MSVIWLGRDEVLHRDVAVKLLASDLTADDGKRDRIRAEALAAARLSHPNIVGVHDYSETEDGRSYVVMELVRGRTLKSLLTDGPLPWPDAVGVCARVAAALAAAHAQGIAHRDVTPGNIMIGDDGVKLVDFGVCAHVGDADSEPDLYGTPAYLAPERLERAAVDPAADVYALGLVLYRTLAGRLPWDADTVTQMIRAHRYVEPAPLPPMPDLPPEVAQMCRRCLARQPADRPDAATVALTLATATGSGGTVELPNAAAPRRSLSPRQVWDSLSPRRVRVAIGAALAALLALVVASTALTPGIVGTAAAQAPGAPSATSVIGRSPVNCQVRYELRRDNEGRFSTALTVRNTGTDDMTDWWLEFTFPGRQRIVDASAPVHDWRQSGQTVLLSGPALIAGGSLTAGLSGEYQGTNAFPLQFQLNDTACRPTLVAAATTVSGGDRSGGDRDREGRGHGKGGKKDDSSGPG